MFNPRLIFSVLWCLQVFLHTIFYDSFDAFSKATWIAVFIALFAFNFGAWFLSQIVDVSGRQPFPVGRKVNDIQLFSKYFLIVYSILAILVTFRLYSNLVALSGGDLSLPNIRQIVVDDFVGERHLNLLFRFYYFGVGFCVFLLSFSQQLSRKAVALIVFIGLISAILTTGRLFLLLFFCASTALLYRNRLISLRTVLLAGLMFCFLFFLIALFLNKGGDAGTMLDSILWNSQVYVMSSLACFNNFILTDAQHIEGGALLPNAFRSLLELISIGVEAKPNLLPFAEVPVYCNTYTVLFPLFHDGSYFGVFLGTFFIGLFHQFLYLKFKFSDKTLWWYLYALSLYPLVMSIFEDAYFSSPGFWVLFYLPPILLVSFLTICSFFKRRYT